MYMSFENAVGKIEWNFDGLYSGTAWQVAELNGFGAVDKSYTSDDFAGRAGQKTVYTKVKARAINILGFLADINNQMPYELKKAIRIFNRPGTLTVNFTGVSYKILCDQVTFIEGERSVSGMEYGVQMICDDPYWADVDETTINLFQLTDHITGSAQDLTTPFVWTSRINEATFHSNEFIDIHPTFHIYNSSVGGGGANTEATVGIKITNTHPDDSVHPIWVKKDIVANEIITINTEGPYITSNIAGVVTYIDNLIDYDTRLDLFVLEAGDNVLKVENYNPNTDVTVLMKFNKKYGEVVW